MDCEIKFDGFRVEAVRIDNSFTLNSKQGKLLTSQFMQIALELAMLLSGTTLDGELVALNKNGVPRFNPLQNQRSGSATSDLFPFEVLAHQGEDVLKVPWRSVASFSGHW